MRGSVALGTVALLCNHVLGAFRLVKLKPSPLNSSPSPSPSPWRPQVCVLCPQIRLVEVPQGSGTVHRYDWLISLRLTSSRSVHVAGRQNFLSEAEP